MQHKIMRMHLVITEVPFCNKFFTLKKRSIDTGFKIKKGLTITGDVLYD